MPASPGLPVPPVLLRLGWPASEPVPAGHVGRVVRTARGLVTVETADGAVRAATGRQPTAVGDWVRVDLGNPSRVADVLPRRSALVRHAAGTATVEQVVAANVDTVFVVVALDHPFNQRRLERTLATAWSSGAVPVVVLTKADRCADVDDAVASVSSAALGVDIVVTSGATGLGVDALTARVGAAETVVLLGASGAGKSTLVNAMAGTHVMATREVRAGDAKGRHTTTHRELVSLPGGGLLIDTPGIRELGLWDADLHRAFPDVEALAAGCRFRDCAHAGEPGCAVADAVAPERLASWHKLQREAASVAARHDKRLAAEQRKQRMPRVRAQRRLTKERSKR